MVDAIIIIVVIVLLGFALKGSIRHFKGEGACCGGSHESLDMQEKKLTSPVIGKKLLKIEGMHCDHCAKQVMDAINKIDGVSAKVDLQSQTATIFYDREINDNELYQAVESAGYHIQSISCS